MDLINESKRALIILAGGLGSRLGSKKALQTIAGRPMIEHIVQRVSNVAQELLVVIGRDESRSEYLTVMPDSVKVINDELGGKSPLLGIVTGLKATDARFAAILSCDIPFVNGRVIEFLFELASNVDAAVPRWRSGHLEPLQAVYRRAVALREAEDTLIRGQLSPTEFIRRLPQVVYVPIEGEIETIDPDLRTFFNVNTTDDLTVAGKMLMGRTSRPEPG